MAPSPATVRHGPAAAVVTTALALGALACSDDDASVTTGPGTSTETAPADPTESGPITPTDDLEIVDTERVDYWAACGDIPLDLDGVRYYPLIPEDHEAGELDQHEALLDEPEHLSAPTPPDPATDSSAADVPATVVAAGISGLAPPEPEDEVGTATVFSDDIVHFISDSGQQLWLSPEPREYLWDC